MDNASKRSTLEGQVSNQIGNITEYRASYDWNQYYNSTTQYYSGSSPGQIAEYKKIGGNVFFRRQ